MSPTERNNELHERLEQRAKRRARRRRQLHHQLAQRADSNGCPKVAAEHRADARALAMEWQLDGLDRAELDELRRQRDEERRFER